MFEAYAPIGSPGRFFKQDGEPEVMDNPVIKEIAEKLNATPAQVHVYIQNNLLCHQPIYCILLSQVWCTSVCNRESCTERYILYSCCSISCTAATFCAFYIIIYSHNLYTSPS